MGRRDSDGLMDWRLSYPEASLLSGGAVCGLRLTVGMLRGPGRRRDQCLVNMRFVLTDQREQAGQLIIYETENGSWGCPALAWS